LRERLNGNLTICNRDYRLKIAKIKQNARNNDQNLSRDYHFITMLESKLVAGKLISHPRLILSQKINFHL